MSAGLRSRDVEIAVLQCVIVDGDMNGSNKAMEHLSALEHYDFTYPETKEVFAEMRLRYSAGKLINSKFLGAMDPKVPKDRIMEVINWGAGVPDVPHLRSYVNELREMSVRRELAKVGQLLAKLAEDKPLAELRSVLSTALDSAISVSGSPIQHGEDWAKLMVGLHEGRIAGQYIPTGFDDLDREMSGGWRRKFFNVIGGYSGTGKTNVMLHSAVSAVENGHVVAYVSQEMTDESMVERVTSMLTGNRPVWAKSDDIASASGQIARWDTRWNFTDQRLDMPGIETFAQDVRNVNGQLDVLFVDYLQLTGCGFRTNEGRYRELAIVAERLSALAKRLDCAVVVGSQLSRAAVSEEPNLTHLRESGDIENTARLVLLLDRPSYRDKAFDKNALSIYIAKQSQGPTGVGFFYMMERGGFTLRRCSIEEAKGGTA